MIEILVAKEKVHPSFKNEDETCNYCKKKDIKNECFKL